MSKLKVKDLLDSESEVLDRIARELIDQEPKESMASHNSRTSGHRSGGSHQSHSSAIKEKLTPEKDN